MARMTRAEMQEHNRRKVIAAARLEFLARGFRDAKIDDIAERADLTRGAVYSNFPSKRALYLTVLCEDYAGTAGTPAPPGSGDLPAAARPSDGPAPTGTTSVPRAAEESPGPRKGDPLTPRGGADTPAPPGGSGSPAPAPRTVGEALAAFARAWTARLPLVADEPRLDAELLPEIVVTKSLHLPFAQLTSLAALTLGLTLERFPDARDRMVRTAEAALTTLHGASQLGATAPHFTDPFAITAAVAHLARLDLGDGWPPPHLTFTDPAVPCDDPWTPPPASDALRGAPAPLTADGIVAILGLHRLTAVEEALRATPGPVTLVIVTADPGELGPLARLCTADLAACLRATVPPSALPRLHIVHDESGTIASAAGLPAPADATEAALRITDGRITARATGFGACHAAASHPAP